MCKEATMRRRLIYAACVASTAVLASWLDLPRRSPAAPPQDAVIGHLVGRNQQITITSTSAGPRYSIERDGKLIAQALTLDELRAQDPAAARQVETATASPQPAAWAGIGD
jgi:hypothetical protein